MFSSSSRSLENVIFFQAFVNNKRINTYTHVKNKYVIKIQTTNKMLEMNERDQQTPLLQI